MGEGWSWVQRDKQLDNEEAAREGWEQVKRDLAAETYRLYVLDEFAYPMHWGWVDTDEVISVLRDRPGNQHVVITGRNAPAELVDFADLVTEMSKVKHPMDAGQKGQTGHRVVSTSRHRRAVVGQRQDHRRDGPDGGLRRGGPRRVPAQGGPRLHRPGLPRAGDGAGGPQPGRVPVRYGAGRAAVRARRGRGATWPSSRA